MNVMHGSQFDLMTLLNDAQGMTASIEAGIGTRQLARLNALQGNSVDHKNEFPH